MLCPINLVNFCSRYRPMFRMVDNLVDLSMGTGSMSTSMFEILMTSCRSAMTSLFAS